MSSSIHSPDDAMRPAWHAAVCETAGRPDLADRLARPASDLLLRFGETYARLTMLPRAQRRRLQRRLGVGLAGAALLLTLGLAPQLALAKVPTGITVDGVTCTLANAITTANTGTNTGGCTGGTAGADTINLTVDVDLTAALPDISSAITLQGNNHTIQRVTAPPPPAPMMAPNGSLGFSVLRVTATGNLTLNQATISGGSATSGAGIYNAGTLTVQNSTISGNSANAGGGIANYGTVTVQSSTLSDNSASSDGGGIFNYGTLTVQDSTLSGNSASDEGGGIQNQSGTLTVQDSTLSGNSADEGGGIDNKLGTLMVQDSTLSGNSANENGGGIDNYEGTVTVQTSTLSGNSANQRGGGIHTDKDMVTVQDSTLSGNSAAQGGGIYNQFGTVTVQNSTLSGNSASTNGGGIHNFMGTVTVQNSIIALQTVGDCYNDSGTLTSQGYNIESGTSCGFTGTGDQQNVTSAALKLYTLADNGGPTLTHGIAEGSVAIDKIPEASCLGLTTDQRGETRPVNYTSDTTAKCDIGAFELQLSASPPNAITLRGLTAAGGSPGGWLAALGAGLAAVLGGLAVRRGGLERENTKGRERHEARRSRRETAGAGYGPPAVVYEAPLEARAGSPLSLPLEELIE